MTNSFQIKGQIVDIQNNRIFPGEIVVETGIIRSVTEIPAAPSLFIMPGFVDSHIHIESSMLTPYEFARKALIHGTVATVSDPHEIANVCGMDGVLYMIDNAADVPFYFNFGAPSCVPATVFETSGATLSPNEVDKLLSRNDIRYLSEMMNYPGVLHHDADVMQKITAAAKHNKPVDGHAPGLTGEDAIKYIQAGISTDHECFTKEEALLKIKHGMKILIREGSAARNFEALHELISEYPDMVMLCSDDKHPDELLLGHINQLVKRAVAKGHSLFDVLKCACINPVRHYKLESGLLNEGDQADFIVVESLTEFNVLETYIRGQKVAEHGACVLQNRSHKLINNFSANIKSANDFKIKAASNKIRVIEAIDGQLITNSIVADAPVNQGYIESDVTNDLLKIAVVNRYRDEVPALAMIRNFNLKRGAIASTVAHDSHNIIVVGVDDESVCEAVNLLIQSKGGLSVVDGNEKMVLPLPIGGLMSDLDCETVGQKYTEIDHKVKVLGCTLRAPFMTLSFMALLVIPDLKLSDKGLFKGSTFSFTSLAVSE